MLLDAGGSAGDEHSSLPTIGEWFLSHSTIGSRPPKQPHRQVLSYLSFPAQSLVSDCLLQRSPGRFAFPLFSDDLGLSGPSGGVGNVLLSVA